MEQDRIVWYEGRRYQLVIGASNCESRKHRHPEPHADGSAGSQQHHHHTERCLGVPRQATLVPMWEEAKPHEHKFTRSDGEAGEICECGAYYELVTSEEQSLKYPGRLGKHLVWYENPPDADHPQGWSYERWEPDICKPCQDGISAQLGNYLMLAAEEHSRCQHRGCKCTHGAEMITNAAD